MAITEKFSKVLVSIFGSRNERVLKGMLPIVERINQLEPEIQALSDSQLRGKTDEFRDRLTHGETLDDILPEAFAVAREASRRVIFTPDSENPQPMRHFDVQLIGGIALHRGCIAEMATGEGKTLVATLATYLNALSGKGVHIVTVNDYLARRDRDWMGPLYEFLGLTAGAIQGQQDPREKQAAYRCDITFGKDAEFGFDYLRDNMAVSKESQVQRGLNFAVVDEVDSVLIDEARTPLIISGASEESTEKYYQADRVARKLAKGEHFEIKEKERVVYLTETGVGAVEKLLGLDNIYAGRNADWPHYIEQALRSHNLYKRDVDYVSKGGEIIIVDEFTGRLMPGRRWSDGLHQAIEAKEHLRIKEENQTLATITYQNYFRMYNKLSGMTGTALTEAGEFLQIYKLDVLVIPTNRPLIRLELPDVVYGTEKEKFDAIEEEIVRQHATGRPLLVGTVSIEKSEHLSDRLKRRGIKHEVLNAKHHEREANIIAKAGRLGNVTIATNMAGRGTDIVLGSCSREELLEHWKSAGLAPKTTRPDLPGDELKDRLLEHWAKHYLGEEEFGKMPREKWLDELRRHFREHGLPEIRLTDRVADLGGLHVIGTERHEARRIDNQLRGRAGRQGDPGSSRFFLSLEDDLMRIFAPEKVAAILRRIGMREGMALESRMVTGSIERAQKKVEERNFDIRKHLLEYDEVMDEQRKQIYGRRQFILENKDIHELIMQMVEDCLYDEIDNALPGNADPIERNFKPLAEWARSTGAEVSAEEWRKESYESLRGIFAERASSGASGSPGEFAAKFAESALRIFCDPETTFMEWKLDALQAWAERARMIGARGHFLPAEGLNARFRKAAVDRCIELARKRYQDADAERLADTLVEDATERFISTSLPPSEWNYDGLAAWAGALGLSLPVNQWRAVEEPMAEEAVDFEKIQRDEIRGKIRERCLAQFKSAKPADVIEKLVSVEIVKLLEPALEEAPSYKPAANWLARNMDAPVSEKEIGAAVEDELNNIISNISANIVGGKHGAADLASIAKPSLEDLFDAFMMIDHSAPGRDMIRLSNYAYRKYGILVSPFELSRMTVDEISDHMLELIRKACAEREEKLGPEKMRLIERYLLLQKMDMKWKDHLLAMDHLKSGIGMRGYGQLDPKVEYTREARAMFEELESSLREEVTDLVLKLDISREERAPSSVWREESASHPDAAEAAREQSSQARQAQADREAAGSAGAEKAKPIVVGDKVGRNSPCPCGSGKKYKNCCGKVR